MAAAAAGADIVETNTFGASPIGMEEFELPIELVRDINAAAVKMARLACDEFEEKTPDRPRSMWPRPAVWRCDSSTPRG